MLLRVSYIGYRSVAAVSISASWRHRSATVFFDWVVELVPVAEEPEVFGFLCGHFCTMCFYQDVSMARLCGRCSVFEHRQFDGARGGAFQSPGRWTHLKSLSEQTALVTQPPFCIDSTCSLLLLRDAQNGAYLRKC